jgi:hypothetical protein
MILCGSRPEGRGSASVVVSEPRTNSFLSVVERKERKFYSHAAEKKR